MEPARNTEIQAFTPESMSALARKVQAVHMEMLCDVETDAASLEAENLFLMALSTLTQAALWLKMASEAQARAIASR